MINVFKYRKTVCIHLDNNMDKVNLIIMMIQKLLSLAQGKCRAEGVDCVMMQEILLGGHLYLQLLKERLQMWLLTLKNTVIKRESQLRGNQFKLTPGKCNYFFYCVLGFYNICVC